MNKGRIEQIEEELLTREIRCSLCRCPSSDDETMSAREMLVRYIGVSEEELPSLDGKMMYACYPKEHRLHLDDNLQVDISRQRWIDKIEQWGKQYLWKSLEFRQHIEKYPYPALDHDVGKRLYEEIDSLPPVNILIRAHNI